MAPSSAASASAVAPALARASCSAAMRAWKAGAAVWRCSRSASETCSERDFRIASSCCSLRMKSRSWLTVCAACRSSCPSCTSRDSFCSSGPMSPKLRLRSCAYSASELLSSRFTGMPGGRPSSSGSTSITPCLRGGSEEARGGLEEVRRSCPAGPDVEDGVEESLVRELRQQRRDHVADPVEQQQRADLPPARPRPTGALGGPTRLLARLPHLLQHPAHLLGARALPSQAGHRPVQVLELQDGGGDRVEDGHVAVVVERAEARPLEREQVLVQREQVEVALAHRQPAVHPRLLEQLLARQRAARHEVERGSRRRALGTRELRRDHLRALKLGAHKVDQRTGSLRGRARLEVVNLVDAVRAKVERPSDEAERARKALVEHEADAAAAARSSNSVERGEQEAPRPLSQGVEVERGVLQGRLPGG
mmetsp:Transcript_18865/g.54472  ORF Transcript_18865/g.54472 Transcript_18865/m.54472 type:complete len:423 (-) Transcript_18865:34-1302(-)